MKTITEMAKELQQGARAVIDRHVNPNHKQASIALYKVLADTMSLCERCLLNPADEQEIRALIRAAVPQGAKGRWVEKSSDIYQIVCRFVFTETDRTNATRYAAALREASKMQINSKRLFGHMLNNGGVNALYFRRPLDARIVKTKCLRLATQIQFSRDHPFRVTLRWRSDNTFEVVEVSPVEFAR